MSTDNCIPGNPDIAGVGVRIAIYVQTLLCFFPAFWALLDGKVSQGELDAAENQATTNLVLAFAILISSIVQAQTLGLTNYHASIVLNMSWLNNTNAFIYFLLYIQHKSQAGVRGRVAPTWRAWVQHIRELAVSVVHPGTAKAHPTSAGESDPELGHTDGVASIRNGVERTQLNNIQGNEDYARTGAKLLVKRFVLLLGSLHLSLMAGLGLWLWSNIRTFGKGQDAVNDCAAKHALLAILGKHVPFASEALRIVSLAIYAVFLVPGVNLLLPVVVFLGFYHLHRVAPTPKIAGSGARADSYIRPSRLRFQGHRAYNSIVQRWNILPPFIGLIFLLAINLVFIVDIELALKQNAGLQGKDEAKWGFGQILAMLLLFMPLRDLAETILARRMKQRQKDLDMGLGGAINAKDRSMVRTWIARGANPNAKFEGDTSAMHMACNLEDLDLIRSLLEAGADPNTKDGCRRDTYMVASDNTNCLRLLNKVERGSLDGVQALVQAAENGYGAAVKLLLPSLEINPEDRQNLFEALSGLNVNARNNGRTALFSALNKAQKFEAIIKFLLTAPGIDVNAPDTSGMTPLTFAARDGHEAVVKLLLAAPGIDVNTPSIGRQTPLSLAAERGYEAVVKFLLAAPGINVNAPNTDGWTPLRFAAQNGHEAVVKLLLAAPGIDVNAPSTSARTPLRFAAENGHEAVVKLLLAAPGIDVNAPDTDGWTPLLVAAVNGHEAVVKLLLAAPGIDVNAPDTKGRTPLTSAVRQGHKAAVKLLIAAPGVDVNAPDTDGCISLIFAARYSKEGVVTLLLTAPGINVNVADSLGRTPLRFAAENGHKAIVKLLLAAPGINVNMPDTNGQTPLSIAGRDGHEAVVKLLLAAPGINVNAPDTDGWTPLSSAARNGREAVVKLLLTAPGIDVNAADTSGWTAMTWAAFEGQEAIVQDLCAVPEILFDVADVQRHLEHPPGDWFMGYVPASEEEQDQCVRILEEFVESKGGGAQDGSEGGEPSGGRRDDP
ncbi:hypothetical protein D9611_008306 [Ephemerocybe angulata]|uniref:Uncharacterized protein n=1 Tax=Ephemerocybe angulata TaxID=980116 RepID=A0A8H5BIY1_9AGAR|nr:hypothetical protein D9611_008306 [Tulosesus angulatus]